MKMSRITVCFKLLREKLHVWGVALLSVGLLAAPPTFANSSCEIVTDVSVYYDRLEVALVLVQYQNNVLRATDGKIRCEEDAANSRLRCQIEGPGEMLVDTELALSVIRLTGEDLHEVHVYPAGDLSCGLASDF